MTSVFAGALTCNKAMPLSLLDYVTMKSDGKSLGAVLGPSAPSIGALRAAVGNPLLPSNLPLNQLLRSVYLPVSTLASDPFQVCAEGDHGTVWYVALACTIVFTLGLPLLGVASLWSAGKLKGLRKILNRVPFLRRGGVLLAGKASDNPPSNAPSSTSTSSSILVHFHTALKNETLKTNVAWFSYWEMVILAIYTGLVGMSKRTRTREGYSVTQGGIIAAATVSILLLWRVQPFVTAHAWKRFPSGALHGLTALTALINALIANDSKGGDSQAQFSLGIVPLIYAIFLCCAIVISWWINTFYYGGGDEDASNLEPQTPGHSLGSTTANPLNGGKCKPPKTIHSLPPPWSRACDGEDVWWVQEGTAASAWELPSGASTTCGWVHRESEGFWIHLPSGAVSQTPPPLDEDAANAIIAAAAAAAKTLLQPLDLVVEEGQAQQGAQWERVHDSSDGDRFWHLPSQGISLYELPLDAQTKCGWYHPPEEGVWVHDPSGATSPSPPSLIVEEADALIQKHLESGAPRVIRRKGGGKGGVHLGGNTEEPQKSLSVTMRAMTVQEKLGAANKAAARASIIKAFSQRTAMTKLEAATLLQVRWRRLKASRSKTLWKKIHALEMKKKLEAGEGGAHHHHDSDIPEGWERRTNNMTGDVFFFHPVSGKSQWEKPAFQG